jgi:hypothetical protein
VGTVRGTRFVPTLLAGLTAALALTGLVTWWLWPGPPRNQPLGWATAEPFLQPGYRYPKPMVSSVGCPQDVPGVVPGEPDGTTTARVGAVWDRIERWLAAYAPATAAALAPPASPDQVVAAQRRMSTAFPPDLVASLRRHDGAGRYADALLPPLHRPLPVAEIVDRWSMLCATSGDFGRRMVPFAAREDRLLIIDQRTTGRVHFGQFPAESTTSFDGWPASVVDLLEQVATTLETGHPFAGHYLPVVRSDRTLEWSFA